MGVSMEPLPAHGHPLAPVPSRQVRRVPDRRDRPTPRFSRYSFAGGRRRDVRREEEREGTYVDRYAAGLVVAIVWVALMNIGDSFFTLVHLQSGGIEVNPIADQLLRTGRFGFVFVKSTLVGVALLVLALHKNFWLARTGLWVAASAYTALNLYHLSLF